MASLKNYLTGTVLLLLFVSITITAKPNITDSLLKVIPQLEGNYKLEAIRQLTMVGRGTLNELKYYNMFYNEGKKQNNIRAQAAALGYIADHYFNKHNSDSFPLTFDTFEQFCLTNKIYKYYYYVTANYVNWFCLREKYSTALLKATETYELAKTENDNEGIILSLKSMAMVYEAMGQVNEAINMTKKALPIINTLPLPNFPKIEIYHRLSNYYTQLNNYNLVLAYNDSMLNAVNNAHKFDSLINLDEERILIATVYSQAYSELGKTQKALGYLNQAEELFNNSNMPHLWHIITQTKSNYYKSAADYNKAIEYNQKFIGFLQQNNMSMDLGKSLKKQADYYTRLNKFDYASKLYAQVIELNDSIDKKRYANQINELRTIYELDKLELEAEKNQLKLKNTRNLAALLSALAAMLTAFIIVVLYNQKKLKAKNRSLFRQITEQQKWADSFNQQVLQADNELQPETPDSTICKVSELMKKLNSLMQTEKLYTQSDLNRKKLADLLNTNETYLFEAIKDTYKLTFNDYLNVMRLEHARELLSLPNTELTIEAIAIDSGFGSRNTFYRLFREKYGLTPVEFRKLANEQQ